MPSAPRRFRPSMTCSGIFASRSISSGSHSVVRKCFRSARKRSPFSTACGSSLGWGWMRSRRKRPRKSSLPKLGLLHSASRAASATWRASFSLTFLGTRSAYPLREAVALPWLRGEGEGAFAWCRARGSLRGFGPFVVSVNNSPQGRTGVDQAIARLGGEQHGVVGMAQLRRLGLAKEDVAYRVRVGRLHRVFRGAYAVGHRSTS